MKRLLFPLPTNISNINYLSGSLFSIYNSLGHYFELIPVGPMITKKSGLLGLLNKLNQYKLFPWRFATMHSWKTIDGFGNQMQSLINDLEYDAVFSTSTLYAASFKTDKPIFCYTDFSFSNALNYYPFASHLFPPSKKEALAVDRFCFEKSNLVFLASEWAKKETEKAYNLPGNKIVAIARGANLTSGYNEADLNQAIENRINAPVKNILFVGVDWKRKGGDMAFNIVSSLMKEGVKAKLQVVGCIPPKNVVNSSFVEVYPFLNRGDKDELGTLDRLFSEAFLFILPTRAEAMGIVFAEAASFGLPAVAYRTGGVGAAIGHNNTGLLFNFEDSKEKMTSETLQLIENDDKYRKFSINAFNKYKTELNWDIIALKIKNIIEPLI